jgi:hypothetical protein
MSSSRHDLRCAATRSFVAAWSFTSGMTVRSVGFLAMSRRSYSVSSVSRRNPVWEKACPCGLQLASRSRELASSSDLLDNPALCAIIRRCTNDPIQTIQFAPAAKYQRYGLAPE